MAPKFQPASAVSTAFSAAHWAPVQPRAAAIFWARACTLPAAPPTGPAPVLAAEAAAFPAAFALPTRTFARSFSDAPYWLAFHPPSPVALPELSGLRRSLHSWLAKADTAGLDESGMVALFASELRDFFERRSASTSGAPNDETEGVA